LDMSMSGGLLLVMNGLISLFLNALYMQLSSI